MNKPLFLITLTLIFALTNSAFSQAGLIPKEEPPFVDEYSGKTIKMGGMAKTVILGRIKNSPRVGEKAPELKLYSLRKNDFTTLSSLRSEKPVVLIFSSWTCSVFIESAFGLTALAREFEETVDFVLVYIREAHPGSGDFGNIMDPKNDEERIEVARKFKAQTRLPFEILVDSHNDTAAVRWAAWPLRVYAVDTNGFITYSGAQGPWGYRPYEGFLHGDGIWQDYDFGFNKNSLESFLKSNYHKPAETEPEKLKRLSVQ